MAQRHHTFLRAKVVILLLMIVLGMQAANKTFYILGQQQGLSNDSVLQMTQLHDGRMLIVTTHGIDIYNGSRFEHIERKDSHWHPLPGYRGATNLSVDGMDRLWVKDWGRVACYNLKTQRAIRAELPEGTEDCFFDNDQRCWTVSHGTLRTDSLTLQLPSKAGILQNIEIIGHQLYAFFSQGCVVVFNLSNRELISLSPAYEGTDIGRYDITSTVQQSRGKFYQVRVGHGGASVFLCYDSGTSQWTTLLRSERYLHTLIITPTDIAYISTAEGYLQMNLQSGESELFRTLRLPDGSVIKTGANTIYQDREGGIWLGTYHDGLLYSSPLSGVFDTQSRHIPLTPVLTDVYLHGERVQTGKEYDGRTLLDVQPPYSRHFKLSYKENAIAFRFSAMNYIHPRSTIYRYRFTGQGNDWHTLSADSLQGMVNDQGVLYLSFVGLAPGDYRLEVMASTLPDQWEGKSNVYDITIEKPWWATTWAIIGYLLLLFTTTGVSVRIYLYREHRRMEQQQREQQLMMRVQQLVEQVNQYQHSAAVVVLNEPQQDTPEAVEPEPTAQEKAFMARATRLVEEHLSSPDYGVEQLAADLCMERTGLYKKLTALMQQSPVTFIRCIRLHRAAELIQKGELSITEIATLTGFSSSSYFSKCFQKEFGCKPSDYTKRVSH